MTTPASEPVSTPTKHGWYECRRHDGNRFVFWWGGTLLWTSRDQVCRVSCCKDDYTDFIGPLVPAREPGEREREIAAKIFEQEFLQMVTLDKSIDAPIIIRRIAAILTESAAPVAGGEQLQSIQQWAKDIIEGVGGLNDFEHYEMAVPHVSDRVWAADWTIKSLANPKCKQSEQVLAAIIERRAALAATPAEQSEGRGVNA